jgi:hypothetical protein
MELAPFESWADVLAYAQTGEPIYYKAPMDRYPARLTPSNPKARSPFTYQAQTRTIKVWPGGSVGRGRNRTADPFSADAGHLERFLRPIESRLREIRVASRRQPSLPGFPDMPDKIEVRIPNDMPWKQIGGDMDPGAHGGTIATADGDHIELLEIQPVRAYVSDDEAKEVGFPFWTKEAWFDLNDLDLKNKDVRSALQSSGFDEGDQKFWFEEKATPEQRAIVIAEALLSYGSGTDEGPSGWSKDLPDHEVEWQRGNVTKLRDYLSDEDDEFRREVLGEEDEEEEEDEDIPEADAKDILEGLGKYLEHEGHDAARESARIARLIASANNSDKVDKVLEEVNRLTDANGIEPINGDYHVDNFYHDIVALYVNMGDTYETTLLYETDKDRFLVTSWGDWVEHNERKYKIR